MIKSKPLVASTHPSEYLLHKYWARKPHNILAYYIDSNFKKGDLVCDPFCGSGVFLAEAKKRGINTIGIDINPLASILTETTLNPPGVDDLDVELTSIIKKLEDKWESEYLLPNQEKIRYLVHAIVAKCKACGSLSTKNDSLKEGSKYICSQCKARIYFNFENFHSTKIIQLVTDSGSVIDRDKFNDELFNEQERKSAIKGIKSNFNKPLVLNRRILAFPGMAVSDLFTPRAFSIATDLFEYAHKINNENVRKAVLLFLTSNLAQFSKLIPYRNNLNTGGPAWTVPGFWIAPIHLEGNPLIHIRARYKKFIKGISSLNKNYKKNNTTSIVKNEPMQSALSTITDGSVDGFFFDPPYGDSVPYLEFSSFWNSFLNSIVNYQDEIVVSDRREYQTDWNRYEEGINEALTLMSRKLKPNGKIVLTFNNLDPKAWKILLEAFNINELQCIEADYQIPAVISSKAQFAINTSYMGDFYCVFQKTESKKKVANGVELIIENILPIFLSRRGKAPKNLIHRYGVLTILQENLETDFFSKLDDIFFGIAESDEQYYVLRKELMKKHESDISNYDLSVLLENISRNLLKNGKLPIETFHKEVLSKTSEIGSPSLSEIKMLLEGSVLFENKYCYLQSKNDGIQVGLF